MALNWPWRAGARKDVVVPERKAAQGFIAFHAQGEASWTRRDYATLAREGFMKNPVVHRAVRLIAETASAVPFVLYQGAAELDAHPLLKLMARPNQRQAGTSFLEALYGHLLLSGNAYAELVEGGADLRELHLLRPDRVSVVNDAAGWPVALDYRAGSERRIVPTGAGAALHLTLFHPFDDHYGFPPLEAALMALDTHNAAGRWNKALLDNSARPSGALVYAPKEGGNLSEEQFARLKAELEDGYSGTTRAGRPLLLEGGLDWKAMGLTPKDMDFIEAKNSASRDIALAFGVPPMLLGIPGDNTYSNYQEANRAFYRMTVMPMVALPWTSAGVQPTAPATIRVGRPHAVFLDLPSRIASGSPQDQLRVAAWQKPWKSQAVLASPETSFFAQRTSIDRQADLGVLVEPLGPGFEGRVHRFGAVTVALQDAEAASISRLQLLNGANAAAVRSFIGAWEIIQFEQADEIAAGIWRLTGLLRGQLGTSDAMAVGAGAGADFVMLDDRVRPAGLLASEIGLPLNWRVGPSGSDISEANFIQQVEAGGLRAQLPLSPVHLKCARMPDGGLAFDWIRRGRLDADDWAGTDIPLGEAREEYRIDLAPPGGASLRSETVSAPTFVYSPVQIVADFGGMPAQIDVTIRQLSLAVGWGLPAFRQFAP